MFTATLLPDTFRAIQLVSQIPEIHQSYLAGGTSLALQIGHRISVDLDFFTLNNFDESGLTEQLSKIPQFKSDGIANGSVWGTIGETKFSIFRYNYPLLNEVTEFEDLRLAHIADIAAMKIHAIENRGALRDFVDLFFLLKSYTLEEILSFYQEKYGKLEDHLYTILRSLDYFEDAEKETLMPNMLIKVEWIEVKNYIRNEISKISKAKLH